MQITSADGRIIIMISDDIYNKTIYPQCDFSIVELPVEAKDAKKMYQQLFKTQKNNHISLQFSRLPKKLRLKAMSNSQIGDEVGFKFYDYITIVSQQPCRQPPNHLSPLGETMIIFTKNEEPNVKTTNWFNPDIGDCTNVWDVGFQPKEGNGQTVSKKFAWETGYLLANLASPLICRKFLVLGLPELSMARFALHSNLQMYAITSDEFTANKIIKDYDKACKSEVQDKSWQKK
jgi:hypothetical protein